MNTPICLDESIVSRVTPRGRSAIPACAAMR